MQRAELSWIARVDFLTHISGIATTGFTHFGTY
jgi:hypothetical protein